MYYLLIFFVGVLIGVLGLAFLSGAKMNDERLNHKQMYRILSKLYGQIFLSENDEEILKEYEDRFLF